MVQDFQGDMALDHLNNSSINGDSGEDNAAFSTAIFAFVRVMGPCLKLKPVVARVANQSRVELKHFDERPHFQENDGKSS